MKLNKILDFPKLIKRLWIILWITLFIFVIAKLCFNIWYPIISYNVYFIKVCNYIDNTNILKYGIMLVFYILNLNLLYLIGIKKFKYHNKIECLIINILIIISFIVKSYNINYGMLIEIILIIIVPIILNLKFNTFNNKILNVLMPIIINILVMIWQLNIKFIRNIDEISENLPVLICYILQIDYYIFITITWIGVNYMGLYGAWFWGKSVTELEALKEKELSKEVPDKKLLDQIDKAIAKRAKKER